MCVEWCILKPAFAMCSHSKDQVCVTGSRGVTFASSRDRMSKYIQSLTLAFTLNPHFNASITKLRSQRKVEFRGNLQWPWLQMAGFKKVFRMISPMSSFCVLGGGFFSMSSDSSEPYCSPWRINPWICNCCDDQTWKCKQSIYIYIIRLVHYHYHSLQYWCVPVSNDSAGLTTDHLAV